MGETETEAMKAPFLGVNQLTIAPHGVGYGPKTAFRYAKIRFLGGAREIRVKSIHVDHIFYPVNYAGSFESSDPMLHRIHVFCCTAPLLEFRGMPGGSLSSRPFADAQ